jgi:DNA-binding NtrC family response regulator
MRSVIAEFNERIRRYREEVERNNKIVVIDDEDVVREVMEEIISSMNYGVLLAETGERGLEIIHNNNVNLSIIDKNLPGISGIEVMREVKKINRDIEVIMFTGYASFESVLEAIDIGAYDYITKPFESIEIVKTRIRKAISKQNKTLVYKKVVEILKEMAKDIMNELGEISRELFTEFANELKRIKEERRENTILIIDPFEDEGRFLEKKIGEWGYRAYYVKELKEAKERIEKEWVDLIIIEKEMEGMDGIKAFNDFKKLSPNIDGILLTSTTNLQAAIEAIGAGIGEYILRPYESPSIIEKKLKKVIREHNERLRYEILIRNLKSLLKKAVRMRKELTGLSFEDAISGKPPEEEKKVIEEKVEKIETKKPPSKEKILVIDDEDVVLEVMKELLEGNGYRVYLAKDGMEGLELVKKEGEFPLAIVDKNLPGMSGLEVIGKIKDISPDTKFIIITGYASIESAEIAMRLGVCEYIVKPFENLNEVMNVVEKTLQKYREIKKLKEEIALLTKENERLLMELKKKG